MIQIFLIFLIFFVLYHIYIKLYFTEKYINLNNNSDINSHFTNNSSLNNINSPHNILISDNDHIVLNSNSNSNSNSISNHVDDLISIVFSKKINNPKKSCVKSPIKSNLNIHFINNSYNDQYRDILTAINILSPEQKPIFNLQQLPVQSSNFDLHKLPNIVSFLINKFIINLNKIISNLPHSNDVINNYNNFLPNHNVDISNKGINKFYKDIGVDYNLYPNTPINSTISLIQILNVSTEKTQAEIKFITSFVVKKNLPSISDQMKLTVHFVSKLDPFEADNLFNNKSNHEFSKQFIAIEYVFVDGFFSNLNINNSVESHNLNDNSNSDFYDFNSLKTSNLTSQLDIQKEFNKKIKEHQQENDNRTKNILYPIFENNLIKKV
jgi:hypothetical protein